MAIKQTLSDFICGRLADVGCFHIFGIPGDYALNIMNAMVAHPKVNLFNCLNELNVSYATEGYARVNGFGAMVVVMGVGELCTLNGLACANAEKIPMLLIVGTMPTCHVKSGLRARHMTDPSDPHRCTHTTASCVEEALYVDSTEGIIDRIDNLLLTSLNRKRPVALHIPTDLQMEEIWVPLGREHLRFSSQAPTRGSLLRGPLDATQQNEINYFAKEALDLLTSAKTPVLVVGNQVVCYNLEAAVICLAESLNAKVMHVPRLTGVIARDHPNFVPTTPLTTEDFDCVCQIGFDLCDMYNGMTRGRIPEIQFSVLAIRIGKAYVNSVFFPDVLKAMQHIIDGQRSDQENVKVLHEDRIKFNVNPPKFYDDEEQRVPMTAKRLAEWVADNGVPNEVLVTCSGLTVWDMFNFPSRLMRPQFGQEVYATIGWALPATLGVMLAYESLQQKPVLSCWIGDGAFVMTAQELASLHKYAIERDFIVRVFLLDNKGYLIERIIYENVYNNLPQLNYQAFAQFAGCHYARVESIKQLEAAVQPEKSKAGATLVHIVLGQFDCIHAAESIQGATAQCALNKIPLDRPTLPGF